MFRVGFGYDVHRLAKGEKLVLGGVEIAFEKGTVGHSDADVLVHSIIDAMLGAVAQKDIGFWFSDKDERYRGIDSMILLSRTNEIVRNSGYAIGNIDCTIVMQRPRLRDYIDAMRDRIAGVLGIEIANVSVKATTSEGMGFEGKGEGMSAYSVVLVFDNK